jgi:hypothetical protein
VEQVAPGKDVLRFVIAGFNRNPRTGIKIVGPTHFFDKLNVSFSICA